MKSRIGWLWGLVTLAIAGVVAAIAYHAGQTATVVTNVARPDGTAVYPGYYYHDGFGFFWILPLLFILLLFFAFRRSGGYGHWGHGAGHWHDHTHGTPGQPPAGTPDQPPGA